MKPSEALAVLRSDYLGLARRVESGEFAVWLGAGITPDNLPRLMSHLLRRLRVLRADGNAPATEALECVQAFLRERAVDVSVTGVTLSEDDMARAVTCLRDRYGDVMEEVQRVFLPASLACDVLAIPETYANDDSPQAAHRLLALLMAEGSIGDVVTTNWDDKLEMAWRGLESSSGLRVVVLDEEVVGAEPPTLVKIHGCARLAKSDPLRYSNRIAVRAQDMRRLAMADGSAVHELIRTWLRQRSNLFVGMSGQDLDIQMEVLRSDFEGFTLPPEQADFANTPRMVFTERESLKGSQTGLLVSFYGEKRYGESRAEIEVAAQVVLGADELLGALYIDLVGEKARYILNCAQDIEINDEQRALCESFLAEAERVLLDACEQVGLQEDAWSLVAERASATLSHCVRTYTMMPPEGDYLPLLPGPLPAAIDPQIVNRGFHRFILALAGLSTAVARAGGSLAVQTGRGSAVAERSRDGVSRSIYVLRRSQTAQAALEATGALQDLDALLVYVQGTERPAVELTPDSHYAGELPLDPQEVFLEPVLEFTSEAGVLIDKLVDYV